MTMNGSPLVARSLPVIRLHPADPVVVALRDIAAGEQIGAEIGLPVLRAAQPVPQGHKLAVEPIAHGAVVRKLGQIIGVASAAIMPGEHVHTHNLAYTPSAASRLFDAGARPVPDLPMVEEETFLGIVRADGSVATRNYIGVMTTVNCSATVARLIADHFRGPHALAGFPNVDGVVALTHTGGCTASEHGAAIDLLRRTLGGYARHPNFAAVLLIGLGCEDNQIDRLMESEGLAPTDRLHAFTIQEIGGTAAAVRLGVGRIRELLPAANAVARQPVSVAHLKLGLQCGGSDGFSALTANPALGVASDLLVHHGGTSILSETPEIYGAEDVLLRRAANAEVAGELVALLEWWEGYLARHGESMDSNPSPGNKAGGITTILEKSLGAAAKGGLSELRAVYRYAEPVTEHGFVYMDTPGYDPVSVTGQVAGGANIICFTTGRGSCFGCKPVPSLKLATNTALYARMQDDMDLNCGVIADGSMTMAETGAAIYRLILATASGQKTKSEILGYGEDEFAPWHFGATL
ncbi:MAG: altronate dehydratase [Caldilineaceae bacterium]|nr:altronate dehydratase [Caldilineaceae bacterium]